MPKNTKEEFKVALHEIPRNVKGEGRILYIFSTKALIYTVARRWTWIFNLLINFNV